MSKRKLLKLNKSKRIIHKGGAELTEEQREKATKAKKIHCANSPHGEMCTRLTALTSTPGDLQPTIQKIHGQKKLTEKRCELGLSYAGDCKTNIDKLTNELTRAEQINGARQVQHDSFEGFGFKWPDCVSDEHRSSLVEINIDGKRLFTGKDAFGQEHVSKCLPLGAIDGQFKNSNLERQVRDLLNQQNLDCNQDTSRACSIAHAIKNRGLIKVCVSPSTFDSHGNCIAPDGKRGDGTRLVPTEDGQMLEIPFCWAGSTSEDCKSWVFPNWVFWLKPWF